MDGSARRKAALAAVAVAVLAYMAATVAVLADGGTTEGVLMLSIGAILAYTAYLGSRRDSNPS